MRNTLALVLFFTLGLIHPSVVHAERLSADAECKPTEHAFAFDCTFMIKGRKSGTPLADGDVSLKADMPSMPMAHNVRPVRLIPKAAPGHYSGTITLEMYGEWNLILDIHAPVRDRVVTSQHFAPNEADAKMKANHAMPKPHKRGAKSGHGGHDAQQREKHE